jgi:hypothetical protein
VFHSSSEKPCLSTFCFPPRPYMSHVDRFLFGLQSTCYPRSDTAGNPPSSRRENRFAAAWEGGEDFLL